MTAIDALLAYASWTLLLIAAVFLYRGLRFVQGTPINHWPRGAKPSDDAPLVKRIEDAHANCMENLPIFAIIVLAAAAMNKAELIVPFAAWVFYARVAQSVAHLLEIESLQRLEDPVLVAIPAAGIEQQVQQGRVPVRADKHQHKVVYDGQVVESRSQLERPRHAQRDPLLRGHARDVLSLVENRALVRGVITRH